MEITIDRESKRAVGERIAMLRKEMRLTQAELAERIGSERRVIAAWESGGRLPDVESWIKLAAEFGVSCDFIAGTSTSRVFKSKSLCDKIDLNRLNEFGRHMLFEYYHMLLEREEFCDFAD